MQYLYEIAAAKINICIQLCKMKMIKNIIFDFGGVIYDIDHHLSKLAFEQLGVQKFDELYGHHKQTQFMKVKRNTKHIRIIHG
jgi:FMN phosphatase YigB (HAD superfamily)